MTEIYEKLKIQGFKSPSDFTVMTGEEIEEFIGILNLNFRNKIMFKKAVKELIASNKNNNNNNNNTTINKNQVTHIFVTIYFLCVCMCVFPNFTMGTNN